MILAVDIRDERVLIAASSGSDEPSQYHQFAIDRDILNKDTGDLFIWDYADESIRNIYELSEKIVLAIPASICLAKRLELDDEMNKGKSNYRDWRAAIQLPGNLNLYEYGYMPTSKSFNGTKTETVFFAAPRDKIERLKKAIARDKPPENIISIPEQIALVELLVRSVGRDDISQAAIVHIQEDYIVCVIIKDTRYFRSRVFMLPTSDSDELLSDVQTFLMSMASPDEPLPLVVTGRTERCPIEWSPVVPVFLNINELDYGVSWGLLEFVAAGGKCVLSAVS